MLWVDGVGGYLLLHADQVTIGGAVATNLDPEADSADIALLANLSRRHATIIRNNESYLVQSHASTRVGTHVVEETTLLWSGQEIQLGNSVVLRFQIPTPLSATAIIQFVSDHRPVHSVDGVILMQDTLLLGAGGDCHVRCPQWTENVVVFLKDGDFWCKSRDGKINGASGKAQKMKPGKVVNVNEINFHLEAC